MAVFAVALALRFGTQVLVDFYARPIAWEYDEIAQNVATGRGYYFDFLGTRWLTFGLPAWPLLEAGLYILSGGVGRYAAIGVAVAVLSAGVALLATLIATRIGGRLAGLFAGVALAFHPGYLVYAAQIHELSLEAFSLGLALLTFLAHLRRPNARTWGATAAAAALAVFVRPTYGAFVLAALGVLVAKRRSFAAGALAVLFTLAAVTAAWTLRTWSALGSEPTPLAPYTCMTLWKGNNPYAPGSNLAPDGRSWWEVQPDQFRLSILGRPEAEQGRLFCQELAAFVAADAMHAVRWWLTKWTWYWWTSPQAGRSYPAVALAVYLALWVLAALLALVGSVTLWRQGTRGGLALVLSVPVPISLAQSAAFVDGRHRLEVEWAVIVLAAIGGATLLRRAASWRARVPAEPPPR